MHTCINRVQRYRINRTIIRNLFNANLYRNRSVGIGAYLFRVALIFHRVCTSVVNIKHPKRRRNRFNRVTTTEYYTYYKVITLSTYNGTRRRNSYTRRYSCYTYSIDAYNNIVPTRSTRGTVSLRSMFSVIF